MSELTESAAGTKAPIKPCNEWPKIEDISSLQAMMETLPLWELLQNSGQEESVFKLSRSFQAKDFVSALQFLNGAGEVAETRGHHPDFHLTGYRCVQVIIYTHSLGGLTENDFLLAKAIDEEVKVTYSPKWLREHPAAIPTAN